MGLLTKAELTRLMAAIAFEPTKGDVDLIAEWADMTRQNEVTLELVLNGEVEIIGVVRGGPDDGTLMFRRKSTTKRKRSR